MAASAATLLLDFDEIGAFVPIRFDVVVGVVVPRDGVEARGFGDAAGDDGIRHADDGRRVHAAAEFGEDGAIGAEPALNGLCEDYAEVLFVFGVGAVADFFSWIEIPVFVDCVGAGSEEHGRGRRASMDADIRR